MLIELDVNLDELGISQSIVNGVNANATRPEFVSSLMETTSQFARQEYNVMVFNLGHDHDWDFNYVVFFATTFYTDLDPSIGKVTYGIWAFKSGEFINLGDGGNINLACTDSWESKYEGHMRFFPPV